MRGVAVRTEAPLLRLRRGFFRNGSSRRSGGPAAGSGQSSSGALDSARSRGTSGVARRTDKGGRGGEAFVMSGTSSVIGGPKSGSSAMTFRRLSSAGDSARTSLNRSAAVAAGGVAASIRTEIVQRLRDGAVVSQAQIRRGRRRTERELVSAIATPLHPLVPEVPALGALHRAGPFVSTDVLDVGEGRLGGPIAISWR